MTRGFVPSLLLSQVRNTAAWALDPSRQWAAALLEAPALDATWQEPAGLVPYLRLMLAAHHATVATFVPTDVDTHIRHHHWQAIADADVLRAAVAVVDETDGWDPRPVSERIVAVPEVGDVCGHAGEWLAVRAGALGRALELGAPDVAAHLADRIDAELAHESRAFERALERARTSGSDVLRVATTLAHNTGDLSRVVEDWPARGATADELRSRWVKLGHERVERWGGAFARAGAINKRTGMADENHRYLPLRKARALRRARSLILPIAPFFDAWGELVARSRDLDDAERAELVGILVDAHEHAPDRAAYLRALAGIARAVPGGLDRLVATHLPARARRAIQAPAIREHLRLDPAHFESRWVKRLQPDRIRS